MSRRGRANEDFPARSVVDRLSHRGGAERASPKNQKRILQRLSNS